MKILPVQRAVKFYLRMKKSIKIGGALLLFVKRHILVYFSMIQFISGRTLMIHKNIFLANVRGE